MDNKNSRPRDRHALGFRLKGNVHKMRMEDYATFCGTAYADARRNERAAISRVARLTT